MRPMYLPATLACVLVALAHSLPFTSVQAARSNPFLPSWTSSLTSHAAPKHPFYLPRSTCAAHSSASSFGATRVADPTVIAAGQAPTSRLQVREERSPPVWTAWIDWGGICRHKPAVVSYANVLDIFVVAPDQGIYHRNRNGDVYTDWEALGGKFTSEPSAVHHASGKMHVVALGADNHIWQAEHFNGKWSAFEDTCIESYHSPGIAAYLEDRYFIFAVSITGRVYYNQYHYGTSEGWRVMGDMEFSSAPVGVSLKESNPNFNFLVGNNEHGIVQWTGFQNGWWSQSWASLDKFSMDKPAVSHRAGGFDIAIRDEHSKVWVNSFTTGGTWSGWEDLGGSGAIGRPAIAASSTGVIYVYAVFDRHALWYRAKYPGGEWSEWATLGNYLATVPSANERDDKFMDVWANDYLHRLSHKSTVY